jgi:hypothetical protein
MDLKIERSSRFGKKGAKNVDIVLPTACKAEIESTQTGTGYLW